MHYSYTSETTISNLLYHITFVFFLLCKTEIMGNSERKKITRALRLEPTVPYHVHQSLHSQYPKDNCAQSRCHDMLNVLKL